LDEASDTVSRTVHADGASVACTRRCYVESEASPGSPTPSIDAAANAMRTLLDL